ncbi:peptide transporter [Mycobacterium sp. SWH-M5]|nr:peptide transporter [Mycobacterium sp. SWH-M5]
MASRVRLSDLADQIHEKPSQNDRTPTGSSGGVATASAIPLDQLTGNPRNPRASLGDLDDLAKIADVQLQPATVVTKAAYLKLYPDDEITAPYVVINGNRRLAAARKFGRSDLEIVVKDELAKDRPTLVAAAIDENINRANLDVIEEARAVEQLVAECGSARDAAKRLGKTDGWVSQRRALLALTPELQESVRRGDIAVRHARSLAKVPTERQVHAWTAHLEREQQKNKAGEKGNQKDRPTSPPQFRTVTAALRNFDTEPAELANALRDILGDDGIQTLLAALKRRGKG